MNTKLVQYSDRVVVIGQMADTWAKYLQDVLLAFTSADKDTHAAVVQHGVGQGHSLRRRFWAVTDRSY